MRRFMPLVVAVALAACVAAFALTPAVSVGAPAADARASVEANRSGPGTITITAVGDMCFASAPGRLMAAHGAAAPLAHVAKLLGGADLTLGNLECALSWRGSPVPGKAFTFRGSPAAVQSLRSAGVDLVGLANNHARDYGPAALRDTVRYLDRGRIAHSGAGADAAKAWAPAFVRSKDATVSFLSFCQIGPADFAAGRTSAGTAYTLSLPKVRAAVRAAKRKSRYVVVSFHWGIEREYKPTARQIAFGHAAVDAGADLVLSQHPHVIQGVEFYRRGLIAYSLGNFVFSPGSTAGHDSVILTIKLGPHGIGAVTARPAHIGDDGAPRIASGSDRKRILRLIGSTSRGRGTRVTFNRDVAKLRKR
jgi:poly-gamma-glutamate capsule biosynthesis protein CapA/YwtB (metallophosphatase superfamily)